MKTIVIIFLCAFAVNASAQTKNTVKTGFGAEKPDIGYFVNPSIQLGKIAGSTAIIPGVGIGIVLNSKICIGLNYQFIASENTPIGESDNQLYLDQRWGGVKFEYSIQPAKTVHINFPIELGVGETELDLKDSYENERAVPSGDARFAYVKPGVSIEINLMKYLKFNFDVGYRFVSDLSFRSLTEKDLMGIMFSSGLKIGIFNP